MLESNDSELKLFNFWVEDDLNLLKGLSLVSFTIPINVREQCFGLKAGKQKKYMEDRLNIFYYTY